MGISLSLCRLSKKRESMLRDDPSLCWELSREVPGYLDVGKAWDALRVAATSAAAEPLVVRLLAGELGKSFGEAGAFGKPRIVAPEEVAAAALALAKVEGGFLRDHLPKLRGAEVHGRFFELPEADDAQLLSDVPELAEIPEVPEPDPQLQYLEDTFACVRNLLTEAAGRGDSLLVLFR